MLKQYMQTARDLFFPSLCFSCESKLSDNQYLCIRCKEQIQFLKPPLCRLCSIPLKNNRISLCKKCITKRCSYNKVISITSYSGPMQALIRLFKYKNCDYLTKLFSSLITTHFLKTGFKAAGYDFITAVPMHPVKLKVRGYNQSVLLARVLANHFKKPLKDGIIYQTKLRASQTRLKKEERAKNTNEMFTAKGNLTGKKIIVVDDMFTTGATAQGCSRALREKGAEHILVITLSKA